MVSDPVCDALYAKVMAATSVDEMKNVMRTASEYVARQHFAISVLQPLTYSLCQPWLKGFNAQFARHGGQCRPWDVKFLSARFWIDRGLKKSMDISMISKSRPSYFLWLWSKTQIRCHIFLYLKWPVFRCPYLCRFWVSANILLSQVSTIGYSAEIFMMKRGREPNKWQEYVEVSKSRPDNLLV